MAEEEIKKLLYVWWHFYRLGDYTYSVERMFEAALDEDYYNILKVATYLHRVRQDNRPLAEALFYDHLNELLAAIDMAAPHIFSSREDMVREEEIMMENLRFFASLKGAVLLVRAYDEKGNELAQ